MFGLNKNKRSENPPKTETKLNFAWRKPLLLSLSLLAAAVAEGQTKPGLRFIQDPSGGPEQIPQLDNPSLMSDDELSIAVNKMQQVVSLDSTNLNIDLKGLKLSTPQEGDDPFNSYAYYQSLADMDKGVLQQLLDLQKDREARKKALPDQKK